MVIQMSRDLILLVGEELAVKLSYLNGSLQGTETYSSPPDDEKYWMKYYGKIPRKITVSGDLAIRSPNGWFLLWQNWIHATEMVRDPEHMPKREVGYKELMNTTHIETLREEGENHE